ncbi:MAG: hypothetical protein ACOYYS_00140 [Chloroflexota bacterium]
MRIENIRYLGWNCTRLSNSIIDLVITADVGPRVIRFGFVDGPNEFKTFAETAGQTGGEQWQAYGGHRLWHAPEIMPRTYFPDNFAVKIETIGDCVRVTPPEETVNSIQKQLDIQILGETAQARVTHRLINTGVWPVNLAVWALSVMDAGGVAIIPVPPRGPHTEFLLPTHSMTMWAYTDMSDVRWTWGNQFILLRQDSGQPWPQKFGMSVPQGWAAYAHGGRVFVKQADYRPGAVYPDNGCSMEFFTNADMLEVESLSPMLTLEPGEQAEHVETWTLLKDIPQPDSETDVVANVLPALLQALAK